MEMKCAKCGKEILPLELYDGNRSCPYCRTVLVDYRSEFVITKENEELFKQAELLYADWLFNLGGMSQLSSVDRAVLLCRQSARLGNPKALARLAYFYDKDYTARSSSEMMRCKVAYEYYSQICFCEEAAVKTAAGLPPLDWQAMREQTACAMLLMLAAAPAELQDNPTYNLKNNLERVRQVLGISPDLTGFDAVEANSGMVDRVISIFLSCLHKVRAPLFGLFRMKITEIRELYAKGMPGKEEKIPQMLFWMTSKKNLWLSYITESDLKNEKRTFTRLSTPKSVKELFDGVKDDNESVWLYFFNPGGGHKYLSAKKRKKVQKTIYGYTGTDLLHTMIQNGNSNFYAFYDDDIYHFMKQQNEANATAALVDKVSHGGDER